MKSIIIDGYVDEPACLGVPPYISPYPRYIYGLLRYLDFKIEYRTIDQLRNINFEIDNNFKYCIVIGGLSVPGKYLNTHPITLTELEKIKKIFSKSRVIIVGALKYGWTIEGGKSPIKLGQQSFDLITDSNNYLSQIFEYVRTDSEKKFDKELFTRLGAECVKFHHYYPNIICEIETYLGCLRENRCSFCIEQFTMQKFEFRSIENIAAEIKALTNCGISHFRIGNQPDIFGYFSERLENGYKPNPDALEKLFYKIRELAENIKTLHTDNANPAVIADFPNESKKIIQILCKYATGGNVLALGCESFDDEVIKKNNLNSTRTQSLKAIELINEYGNYRSENGMPQLLPGINLLFGLVAETPDTWKINYEFLKEILARNLLVRRINIRQVIKFENTELAKIYEKPKNLNKLKYNFKSYREKIREEIDKEMLKKIAPLGVIIKEALVEKQDNNLTFARQLGAYPLLIGTAEKLQLFKYYDFVVVNYGYRSITGLSLPIKINQLSYQCLKTIYGINKKQANDIIFNRPYSDITQIPQILKKIVENVEYIL
ncbi:MAG TPA: radical SAM protein [bacterium]|nr:radical SAM protein [bacterium]HPP86750.1 radical SAM protein [bacterium]